MDIILNKSCSADNDYIRVAPIDGTSHIRKDKIKPGVWTTTIAYAIPKKACKSTGKGSSVGKTCTQYGGGGSGTGIVIQETTAVDGGTSGMPYKQHIITTTGAM